MSATTDVILAAGPTVVAVVAIGAGVWQQKRGQSHDRVMADLGDVRGLLDDAAVALHEADYIYGAWLARGITDSTSDDDDDDDDRLVAARKTIDRTVERLAVRLGPNCQVVQDLRDARAALFHMEQAANGGASEARHEALQATGAELETVRTAFLNAAAKTAGARLP